MINDLGVNGIHTWKYVNYIIIAEIDPRVMRGVICLLCPERHECRLGLVTTAVEHAELNTGKCKMITKKFKKKSVFSRAVHRGKELSVTDSVKITGVTL